MIFHKSDDPNDVLKNIPSPEQTFLENYLSVDLSKREAKYLWEKIVSHKWYVSERLKRDVGLRVAAIDYVENFYEPTFFGKRKGGFKNSLSELFKIISQGHFLRPGAL
jgi:hypothetical protein